MNNRKKKTNRKLKLKLLAKPTALATRDKNKITIIISKQ